MTAGICLFRTPLWRGVLFSVFMVSCPLAHTIAGHAGAVAKFHRQATRKTSPVFYSVAMDLISSADSARL